MDSRSLDGWLSKLATTRSGSAMWQRRWFVLLGDRLSYFNSPADASGEAKWALELGTLGASASQYRDPATGESDPTRFDLRAGGEVVSLKADSEVEAEMWVCALETQPSNGAAPAGGLFDGLAMPTAVAEPVAPQAAAPPSAFGFLGGLGAPSLAAAPAATEPPPPPYQHPSPALPSGLDPSAAPKKKKVMRKAKQPGSFGDDSPDGGAPRAAPPTVEPAPPAAGLGGMFDGMDFGAPAAPSAAPPPPPEAELPVAAAVHDLGLVAAPAASLSSASSDGSSSSAASSPEPARPLSAVARPSATGNGYGAAAASPNGTHHTPAAYAPSYSAAPPPPPSQPFPTPAAYQNAAASPYAAAPYSSASLSPASRPSSSTGSPHPPSTEKRKKKPSERRSRSAAAASAGIEILGGAMAGLAIPAGAIEELDVEGAAAEARRTVGELRAAHAALCGSQAEVLRRVAGIAAELAALDEAKEAARIAQVDICIVSIYIYTYMCIVYIQMYIQIHIYKYKYIYIYLFI